MKKYQNIEDFLNDVSFQNYVYRVNKRDITYWEEWFRTNTELSSTANEAKEIMLELENQGKRRVNFSVDKELNRLNDRIKHNNFIEAPSVEIRLKRYLQVAATIIILLTLGLTATVLQNKKNKTQEIAYMEIVTPKGARAEVTLGDGTKVWLNADSKLKYPSRFTNEERKVYFTGEGYFDVAKEKNRPFVLMTTDVRVNVLGTKFNIKSYPEDNYIETTLETGLLSISPLKTLKSQNINNEIVLKPKQKIVLYKDEIQNTTINEKDTESKALYELNDGRALNKVAPIKEAILTENVETEIYVGWKDEKLIFRSEKLIDIVKKLERWYDVNIDIDEELWEKVYSGKFQDETLEQALDAICLTSNSELKYSIEKNNVKIFK